MAAQNPLTTPDKKIPRREYDAAEHRVKHCWNKPYADVVMNGSHTVGKCPSTLSKEEARALLDHASYVHKDGVIHPEKMWNVHEGVIYEAVPTREEGVYHGYPWSSRPGLNRLPRQVMKELKIIAEKKNCVRQFKDWIKDHGDE